MKHTPNYDLGVMHKHTPLRHYMQPNLLSTKL